jgi:hypothetical protein
MRLDEADNEQIALAIANWIAADIDQAALERFAKFASAAVRLDGDGTADRVDHDNRPCIVDS